MTDVQQPTSIFEATATLIDESTPQKGASVAIVKNISDLLRAFGSADHERVEKAFEKLTGKQPSDMLQRVGQMTRNLHQSLQEFNTSLSRDPHNMQSTNIVDATVKLENVVKATAEAAHKTLGFVESQSNALTSARDDNKRILALLDSGASTEEIRQILTKQDHTLASCENFNNEILMAQSFQDLTGQAIKKVITLVSELEQNLISMIKIFGVPERSTTQTEATKSRLEQDAVDSILSDFGF